MTITEQIRESLVLDILKGTYAPGDKFLSEMEAVTRFKASRITVRRAYAQLEQAGVITRKKRAGTVVNAACAGNVAAIDKIAVVTTLDDAFSRTFVTTIHREALKRDILLVLEVVPEDGLRQNQAVLRLVAKGVRNIILWGFDRQLDFDLFARSRTLGTNLVFFDRIVPENFADYVGLDNRHAIETLFRRAVADGAKRFVYVDASDLDVDSNRERLETFLRECRAVGATPEILAVPWRTLDSGAVEKAFATESRGPEPAAVFCANDTIAIAVRQRAPDRPIYGVDGLEAARRLGVVSYSQPIEKMASAALTAIFRQNQLGPKWVARQYRFKGELVVS